MLTVTDVERLAKAGVTMQWRDIAGQVMPDAPPPEQPLGLQHLSPLTELLLERWRRREVAKTANSPFPFPLDHSRIAYSWRAIHAASNNSMVYVFVLPDSGPPAIIEDALDLFPSDALMASLILLEATKP